MNTHKDVLVLIINYKTSHLMPGLLHSIVEEEPVSILILDNGSTPETFAPLSQLADSRVQVLRSEKNLGFTGGVNYALRYALESLPDTKYFFLLNPDALSRPNLITHLKGILKAHPNAAGVSPQVLRLDGSSWYAGAEIDYKEGKVSTALSPKNEYNADCCEIDVFSGCAVLFDFKKVVEAGMFNEELFMYYDEADLSIKLKKLGYKILYARNYAVHHDASYTTRHISFLKTYYMTRNKFMVFNDTMSVSNKLYFIFHELAFHLKYKRLKNAVFHLKGYYHFLRGKTGDYRTISQQ